MMRRARSLRLAPRSLLVLLASAALACAVFTHPFLSGLPTLSAQTVAPLSATIDDILASGELARGTWGLSVHSLDRGDALYERNADKLLLPASTLKIVTLAVAAERLGWDYTYATRLYRTGILDGNVLHGDLVIVGSGDPSIDDWDGVASGHFHQWAAALRDAGITRVTGRVIGDDNIFDDDDLGNGWAWDDVSASYSAGVSGLQFNQNSAQIVVSPGRIGKRPFIHIRPPAATLTLVNHATTASDGPPLQVRPVARSASLEIVGTVPPRAGPVTRTVSVANPTLYFVEAARTALIADGIRIDGPAIDVDDLAAPISTVNAPLIAEFRSPSLKELASTMMRFSQNLFAESLLKTLAATPAAAASASAGRALVNEQLAAWGLEDTDVVIADGSGLSRYNLITPRAQAAVLARVYASDTLRTPFVAALPVAGQSGTLERRMNGTAAAGNARAKTGSFLNARGMAGFVRSAGGEMLVFSILANNYNASPTTIDDATDAIVVLLSELRRP